MKSRIDILLTLTSAILSAVILWSCSGNTDPEEEKRQLVLTADKTEVMADGEDQVTFTVMYGDEDVTSSATFSCSTGDAKVTNGVFRPSEGGEFIFTSGYDGATSNSMKITASEPVFESSFQRHVCVMEFTGTWCAQCPEGATTLNYLVSKAYKDKAFALAFHNADDYALPQEQALFKIFKWAGYPAYVTDMRDCGLLTEGGCGASIEKSLYDVPTYCAAAVECTFDTTSSSASVNARIFSEKTGEYRLAAYIVEDKVVGKQQMSSGEMQENYTHRHVVRKMLSADVRGDNMGKIASGKESKKTYTFSVSPDWNLDNLSVAVLAITEGGTVNNMAICAVNGGKMDYKKI